MTAELARGRTLIATHSAQFGSLSLESIIYGPRRMAFSPVYVSRMYEPAALRDCDSRACSRSHSHCRKPPFSGGLAASPRPDDPPVEADPDSETGCCALDLEGNNGLTLPLSDVYEI